MKKRTNAELKGLRILLMTSGHDVSDSRVYHRIALSIKKKGAIIYIVGEKNHVMSSMENINIIAMPKPTSRFVRFFFQPWRCIWHARNVKPHIVHFHDAELLFTLPVAKFLWPHSKFIYDVHEDFANLMLIRDWIPRIFRNILRSLIEFFEKKSARLADAIIGVTPPLTDKFRLKNKITAYNFIPDSYFQLAKKESLPPSQRNYDLIHLGTLNMKRMKFLVEIFNILQKTNPNFRILIIGVSSDIHNSMAHLIPDICEIKAKIPAHEVPQYLGNARIGINVHPWLLPHLKVALPVKVGEYLASGCAVVSSSLPILNAILSQSKEPLNLLHIVNSQNPVDYALAIQNVSKMLDKTPEATALLQTFVFSHMNWRNEAEKIKQLYKNILEK